MTTLTRVGGLSTPESPNRGLRGLPHGVVMAAVAVVAIRLPFVGRPLAIDEAGYLTVARQWAVGGSSLYGDYWVDRPPMLITIFRGAALLGGAVPLRLIGIAAATVAVLAVGRGVDVLAGRRASMWAAVTCAAFLISPFAGATEVNGELLASPFIAVGVVGLIEALTCASPRRAVVASAIAGASGVAAILVKQNMLDVLVFSGVLVVLTARTIGPTRLKVLAVGFTGAALLMTWLMALWTLAHGTSLSGVWFAMYQFRAEAHTVMAAHPSAAAALRERMLVLAALSDGMVLVAGLLVRAVLRRGHDHPSSAPSSRVARAVLLSLLATVGYDVLSIYLGGDFWTHYLIQLAVPLSLAAGLAVTTRPRLGRVVVGLVASSAMLGVFSLWLHPLAMAPAGDRIGAAIGAVARPSDTIVTVWGHSDVTHASRLSSPYPYLWSLPERTLDPQLRLLDATLEGPAAPTWFVTSSGTALPGVDTSTLRSILAHAYHRVRRLPGFTVYLHNGVPRKASALISARHLDLSRSQ